MGEFAFVDRVGGTPDADNQSLFNVGPGSLCLTGRARGLDTLGDLPHDVVSFTYQSLGDVTQASTKSVKGDFMSVLVTLDITGTTTYSESITSECQLKGRILKSGERAKVRVTCDAGEFFSSFPFASTAESQMVREHLENAFPNSRKHIKVDTRKGKIRITHDGVADETDIVDLSSCGLD